MKLADLFKIILDQGIRQDPRDRKQINKYLDSVKKEYHDLPDQEKKFFDKDKFINPYSDTRILYGSLKKNIKTIMVGVDMETPELLLADRLKEKGKKIDLVLSHHPQGFARAEFYRVMNVLDDILALNNVKGAKIKKRMQERISEVARKVHAGNCPRPLDAARLLDIPYACAHTAADNFAYQFFKRLFDKQKPKKVADIFDLLYRIPEMQIAMKNNQGPRIIHGKKSAGCGKILVEMTGGTEGPKDIYKDLAKGKVKTIVGMHLSEEHLKKAKKHDMNIIIAGHISSDSIGINLLLDQVLKHEKLNIIPCSGFTRIHR